LFELEGQQQALVERLSGLQSGVKANADKLALIKAKKIE